MSADKRLRGWTRRSRIGLGMGVLLWLAVGATGCKKKRKMRCSFPAATLKQLRSQGDDPPLSLKQRQAQVQSMVKHCRGWKPALKIQIQARGIREEMPLRMASAEELKEMNPALEKLCPGIVKRLENLGGGSPQEYSRLAAGKCKVDLRGTMSRREYQADPLTGIYVLLIYKDLRAGGVDHAASRALVRSMMTRGHLHIQIKEGEMMLPPSNARTVAVGGIDLMLSASTVLINREAALSVESGRIDAKAKGDGPNGHYITPVHKQLTQQARAVKARGRKRGQLGAEQLVVSAHKDSPWRPLGALIYTARKAAYSQFQLVVQSNSIWDRVILFEAVTPAGSPASEPRIRFDRQHYSVLPDGSTVSKTFPSTGGKRAASLKALAAYLHKQGAQLKGAGRWGVVHIEVDDTVKIEQLVNLLDALRLKPGSKPESCRFAFDAKAGRWILPPATKKGCLLPYPKLHVGPPAKVPPTRPAPEPDKPGKTPSTQPAK